MWLQLHLSNTRNRLYGIAIIGLGGQNFVLVYGEKQRENKSWWGKLAPLTRQKPQANLSSLLPPFVKHSQCCLGRGRNEKRLVRIFKLSEFHYQVQTRTLLRSMVQGQQITQYSPKLPLS